MTNGSVLLVHEGGAIEQQDSWTDDLYAAVEVGVVEVIRFHDGKFQYLKSFNKWVDV